MVNLCPLSLLRHWKNFTWEDIRVFQFPPDIYVQRVFLPESCKPKRFWEKLVFVLTFQTLWFQHITTLTIISPFTVRVGVQNHHRKKIHCEDRSFNEPIIYIVLNENNLFFQFLSQSLNWCLFYFVHFNRKSW